MLSYFLKIGYLNCLIMNASNKRRIDEKKCGVYSRAAFNNIFACSCGVYSRAAFIRIITVIKVFTYFDGRFAHHDLLASSQDIGMNSDRFDSITNRDDCIRRCCLNIQYGLNASSIHYTEVNNTK